MEGGRLGNRDNILMLVEVEVVEVQEEQEEQEVLLMVECEASGCTLLLHREDMRHFLFDGCTWHHLDR
jgi:hypothetical protein